MSALKPGDTLPSDVTFSYIADFAADTDAVTCGRPINFEAAKEFAGKKVVLFAVPGAFTPTCSARHVPGFLENVEKFKALGVSKIAVLAYNDPFVMNAWRKDNGVTGDYVLFLSDPGTAFSQRIGWTKGERTGRYAIVLDDNKVVYAENEPGSDLTVSGADAVLNFLEQKS